MAVYTKLSDVFTLVSSAVSVNVYSEEIPESETDDAVHFYSVAHTSGRDVEGRKSKKSSTWRVEVVATTVDGLESIIEDIETLDNKSTSTFQRVYAQLLNTEDVTEDQEYRRAFIDLTVYPR